MSTSEVPILGRRVIAEAIAAAGVDTVFTMAGGHFLGTYHEMGQIDGLRVVAARHEQGAGYMASGYALVTGRPGVVFSGAPGPGATNLVTAVANAYADSIPLLVLTAQVDRRYVHRNILQYCDNVDLFGQFSKQSMQAASVDEVPNLIAGGLQLAASGRPGPVHIALPQNLQAEVVESWTPVRPSVVAAAQPVSVSSVLDRLAAAHRPAILAGHGVIRSGGTEALAALAQRVGAPVATSRSGVGSIPTDHDLSVGMLGFYGTDTARDALAEADFVLIVGCAMGEQTTFGWRPGLLGTAVRVQVDIDASQINRVYPVDEGLVADAGATLGALADGAARKQAWFRRRPERIEPQNNPANGMSAADFLRALNDRSPDDVIVSADIGNHRLWVCEQLDVSRPDGLLQSCEFDAMGFSLPAAIGAAVATGTTKVVSISGDGGFVHTMGELTVAKEQALHLVAVVFIDGALGILKHQAEEMFGDDFYVDLAPIDFEAMSRAFGVEARTITTKDQLDDALDWAMAAIDPVLLAVAIDPEEVFPPLRTKIEQRKIDLLGPAKS